MSHRSAWVAAVAVMLAIAVGFGLEVVQAGKPKASLQFSFGPGQARAESGAAFVATMSNSGGRAANLTSGALFEVDFGMGSGPSDLVLNDGSLTFEVVSPSDGSVGVTTSSGGFEVGVNTSLSLEPGDSVVVVARATAGATGAATVQVSNRVSRKKAKGPKKTVTVVAKTPARVSGIGDASDLFFGDGSDGELIATDGMKLDGHGNYTDVTIPSGVTVTVDSGATIRCTGTFDNRGTIAVGPGDAGALLGIGDIDVSPLYNSMLDGRARNTNPRPGDSVSAAQMPIEFTYPTAVFTSYDSSTGEYTVDGIGDSLYIDNSSYGGYYFYYTDNTRSLGGISYVETYTYDGTQYMYPRNWGPFFNVNFTTTEAQAAQDADASRAAGGQGLGESVERLPLSHYRNGGGGGSVGSAGSGGRGGGVLRVLGRVLVRNVGRIFARGGAPTVDRSVPFKGGLGDPSGPTITFPNIQGVLLEGGGAGGGGGGVVVLGSAGEVTTSGDIDVSGGDGGPNDLYGPAGAGGGGGVVVLSAPSVVNSGRNDFDGGEPGVAHALRASAATKSGGQFHDYRPARALGGAGGACVGDGGRGSTVIYTRTGGRKNVPPERGDPGRVVERMVDPRTIWH